MFFNLLAEVIHDESGITVNPNDYSKYTVLKHRHQVGVLISAEKGVTLTAEMYFSASGASISPTPICSKKRSKDFN
jgi:hypothetical protein